MAIPKDELKSLDADGPSFPDLEPDTTQGMVYRFLLEHADQAFRQRDIVDAVDVPEGGVGPTLKRLEEHDLVYHRGSYWAIADAEHAVGSAELHCTVTADDFDGGFSDDDIAAWMEAAVEPIDSSEEQEDEVS
jgi:hypothetical protein